MTQSERCPTCRSPKRKFEKYVDEGNCPDPWHTVPVPEAKGMSAEPTINNAARFIRKLEACESIGAKLILVKHFCERYAEHSLAAALAELAAARSREKRLQAAHDQMHANSSSLCEFCEALSELAESALRETAE